MSVFVSQVLKVNVIVGSDLELEGSGGGSPCVLGAPECMGLISDKNTGHIIRYRKDLGIYYIRAHSMSFTVRKSLHIRTCIILRNKPMWKVSYRLNSYCTVYVTKISRQIHEKDIVK